jgi:hypothetical protein
MRSEWWRLSFSTEDEVTDRLAWRVYWWTLVLWLAVAIAYAVFRRTFTNSLVWAIVLSLPLFLAGLNLTLYSRAHERVCAIEVARHRWLRTITMGGYSARAFLITGLAAMAISFVLAFSIAGGQ